jgi:hypothetical protein
VATLEAPKAPSSSPTLEGETTFETFLLMQRRWLTVVAATPTHLHPAIFFTQISSSNKETVTGLS